MANKNKFRGLDFGAVRKVAAFIPLFIVPFGCAPTISGSIVAPDHLDVHYDTARINISSLSDHRIGSYIISVEKDGRFRVGEKLEKGRYLVEALVPGFRIASTELTLDKSQDVKIELVPLPKSSTKAIGINLNLDESRGTGGATLTPPSL
jgi:hypothetical protein